MQNPFSRLKTFFATTFQSSADNVIGVDVGSAYLKIVQLRRKGGKAILETYGSLALGPYAGVDIGRATRLPADKIGEAIRDLMREAHATTKQAACAIPFSSSLVTAMDMRVLDPKELAAAVPLEARKHVPVPISEVHLDWWIIPEEPPVQENVSEPPAVTIGSEDQNAPRNIKVLIAAIHNEALQRYQTIMKQGELQTSFFEIEMFSAIRSLFPQDLEPHAILDLGAGETKLYLVDRGLVRLSHSINHGGQDITLALSRSLGIGMEEAEKLKREEGLAGGGESSVTAILNVLFSETNRALQSFQRKFGRAVKDIVLSGGGANLAGIEPLAAQSCLVPVMRADPFAQVEAPAFLDEVLKAAGPEFTVAIGIAFRKLQEST